MICVEENGARYVYLVSLERMCYYTCNIVLFYYYFCPLLHERVKIIVAKFKKSSTFFFLIKLNLGKSEDNALAKLVKVRVSCSL